VIPSVVQGHGARSLRKLLTVQEPAEPAVLTVEVIGGGGAPRLVVTGDLDLDGAKVLDQVIEQQGASVELDLTRVQFMDSSGLRSLLVHHNALGVTIVDASAAVTRVCELASVTFLFEGPRTSLT
jgi:anti-anti-sigma factor